MLTALGLVAAGAATLLGDRPDAGSPSVATNPREPLSAGSPTPPASPTPSPVPERASRSGRGSCPLPRSGFTCDLQTRILRADAYLTARPGKTGLVVADRRTGAVWRNRYASREVYTASTSKLGIAIDLLVRDRTGSISLTAADRRTLDAMLRSSDDGAANRLWFAYGGPAIVGRFATYGAPDATFVPGLNRHWGSMKCTPEDLAGMMRYVLEDLPADLRAQIMGPLRGVAANQRWGVWAAGPAMRPGNKNGWWGYSTGYVINSVGFLGEGDRYVLSLMSDGAGEGGYDTGVTTTSGAARMIFSGLADG